MDELNFARDENKKILLVYLNPVELPVGMRMRLNRLQAINKYTFETETHFYEKLYSADGFVSFCEPVSQKISSEAEQKSNRLLLLEQSSSAKTKEIGTLQFSQYTYTGEIADGKANGRGVAVWKTGGKWQGTWENNKPVNGSGIFCFSNGNIYSGIMKNSMPDGNGKLVWSNGGEWEGEWKDDSPLNGKGTVFFSKFNHRYVGEIKNGKRNGQGTMYWASFNQRTGKYVVSGHWSLSGEWRDNQIWNGEGNSGAEKPWEIFRNGTRLESGNSYHFASSKQNNVFSDDDFYSSINKIINDNKK